MFSEEDLVVFVCSVLIFSHVCIDGFGAALDLSLAWFLVIPPRTEHTHTPTIDPFGVVVLKAIGL